MTEVYFYFEDAPNVRGHWTMDVPPNVGDEVELWKPAESPKTCIVTRRKWVPVDTGSAYIPPALYVVDVFVKVVDRSEVWNV